MYSFSQKIMATDLGGEVVILDLDSGEYYGLNETAYEIWQSIANGEDINKSVEKIALNKGTSLEELKIDFEYFLSELLTLGFIVKSD